MPAALSVDLRQRVVAAYKRGEGTQSELAERFDVGERTLRYWLQRYRGSGELTPRPHGGGQRPRLDEAGQQRLKRAVQQRPDATLVELIERVGVAMDDSTLSRWCGRLRLTRKKDGAGRRAGPAGRARAA